MGLWLFVLIDFDVRSCAYTQNIIETFFAWNYVNESQLCKGVLAAGLQAGLSVGSAFEVELLLF